MARRGNCACDKPPRSEVIARLNDDLRCQRFGSTGTIQVTRSVLGLPGFDTDVLLAALAAYDAFDSDNDPHGERDFGDLPLFGAELFWKIDYYVNRPGIAGGPNS